MRTDIKRPDITDLVLPPRMPPKARPASSSDQPARAAAGVDGDAPRGEASGAKPAKERFEVREEGRDPPGRGPAAEGSNGKAPEHSRAGGLGRLHAPGQAIMQAVLERLAGEGEAAAETAAETAPTGAEAGIPVAAPAEGEATLPGNIAGLIPVAAGEGTPATGDAPPAAPPADALPPDDAVPVPPSPPSVAGPDNVGGAEAEGPAAVEEQAAPVDVAASSATESVPAAAVAAPAADAEAAPQDGAPAEPGDISAMPAAAALAAAGVSASEARGRGQRSTDADTSAKGAPVASAAAPSSITLPGEKAVAPVADAQEGGGEGGDAAPQVAAPQEVGQAEAGQPEAEPPGAPALNDKGLARAFARLSENPAATAHARAVIGELLQAAGAPGGGVEPEPVGAAQAQIAEAAKAVQAGLQPNAPVIVPNVPLGALPVEIGLKALAGVNRFQIRLDPAELGRIEVNLEIDDEGTIKARLTVDRVETLSLLQRDARTLERAFEQAGLKPSEAGIDMSLRDDRRDERREPPGHAGRDEAFGERGRREESERLAAANIVAPRTIWRGAAGVDVRI